VTNQIQHIKQRQTPTTHPTTIPAIAPPLRVDDEDEEDGGRPLPEDEGTGMLFDD